MSLSRPTLEEVARACGVHKSTVSLALRHSSTLPATTRQRIQSMATKLGYRPDPLLAAFNAHRRSRLPQLRSRLLAWITDDATAPTLRLQAALSSAREEAARRGFQVDCFSVGPRSLSPSRLNRILLARGADAVLLFEMPMARRRLDFSWDNFCALAIDSFHLEEPIDTLALDLRQRALRLTSRILGQRGKVVGLFLDGEQEERRYESGQAGFLIAHALQGRSPPPPLRASQSDPVSRSALVAWIKEHRVTHVLTGVGMNRLTAPPSLRVTFRSLQEPSDAARLGRQAVRILAARVEVNLRGLSGSRSNTLLPD